MSLKSSSWITVGAAAVGLVGVASVLALRQSSRTFVVTSTIARAKQSVFELHAVPASFYRVLEFKEHGDKGYTVLSVTESPDRTSLTYDLSHASALGTIRSRPVRYDIVRSGATLSFKEAFAVLGTTLEFLWSFVDTPNSNGASTDITLNISLTGPALAVAFLTRVERDFQARFATTQKHLDKLIPLQ